MLQKILSKMKDINERKHYKTFEYRRIYYHVIWFCNNSQCHFLLRIKTKEVHQDENEIAFYSILIPDSPPLLCITATELMNLFLVGMVVLNNDCCAKNTSWLSGGPGLLKWDISLRFFRIINTKLFAFLELQ